MECLSLCLIGLVAYHPHAGIEAETFLDEGVVAEKSLEKPVLEKVLAVLPRRDEDVHVLSDQREYRDSFPRPAGFLEPKTKITLIIKLIPRIDVESSSTDTND